MTETAATSRTAPFACPACREPLDGELRCAECGRTYGREAGIPVLLGDLDEAKREQIAHFDEEVDPEFEITRPHGQPRLYGMVLAEKFRRATRPIAERLPGASVLCVCAGSGLDAEFLARRGAHVVASDISPGAAARTAERARRQGLDITPVVADVEQLPFADQSFDVVFVHDGLHHIERPEQGLLEMVRVARQGVSVTEPAQASLTRIAVRLGLAVDREEVGNVVARLRPECIAELLEAAGFDVVHRERYGLFYRHEPGPAMRLLSLPGLARLSIGALRGANAVAGAVGNKLAIVGVRR